MDPNQMDNILFFLMLGIWIIMPVFITWEEFRERKALKASELATEEMTE